MTRSLLALLCQGLDGAPLSAITELDQTSIARIIGPELMELRSLTAIYVLQRFHEAATHAVPP